MHTAAFRFRFFATIVPYISNISSMFGEFALQKCIWCPKGIREPIYMPVCVLVRFLYLCTTSDVIHAIHLIEFEQLYSFFLICCLFLVKRLLDQRQLCTIDTSDYRRNICFRRENCFVEYYRFFFKYVCSHVDNIGATQSSLGPICRSYFLFVCMVRVRLCYTSTNRTALAFKKN